MFLCLTATCSHLLKYTRVCVVRQRLPRVAHWYPSPFLQAEARAESSTQRDDGALLTEVSTSQHSLLSQPVLPDIQVITGVEESPGTAADQEDKEELEFPHDLLPSLDFSSELNIWESSLG